MAQREGAANTWQGRVVRTRSRGQLKVKVTCSMGTTKAIKSNERTTVEVTPLALSVSDLVL